MTATNHVLTGAIIGSRVQPFWLALPLALLSHFILDSLPHYGSHDHISKAYKIKLYSDMTMAAVVLLAIFITKLPHWPVVAASGIIAASPDLMWLPRWLKELRKEPVPPMNRLAKFHWLIQWGESPYGWPIEIIWTCAAAYYLFK